MATAELPTTEESAEQRLVLRCIDWATYVAMGKLLEGRHIRLTYDRGALEIMTLSPRHERRKKLLARLAEMLTAELDIDIVSAGSMTFQREDLERGLEPDECYWIEHEPQVRGRNDIDPANDPPPDLVIEVEVSRNVIGRLPIYAALGVPEVWRWDGTTLQVLLLGADGQYARSGQSKAFPFLPLAEFARFLTPDPAESETKWLNAFRTWVRENAPHWAR